MGIWRDLFGESQRDAWTRLAGEIGGAFVEGRFTSPASVRATLGGFDLVLDTYTVSTGNTSQTYTRLRAPFVNGRGLRFHLHRAHALTRLAKLLGQQDIEIGDAVFDRAFVVQGNDAVRVQQILADASLRALLLAQPTVGIEIVDDDGAFGPKYGAGVDVLAFAVGGVVKDVPRLVGLFSLFPALLHAFRANARHFLEVPPAELSAAFIGAVAAIGEHLGAQTERVTVPELGDAVELRVPDPIGVAASDADTPARVLLAIPALPALTTRFRFEAPLVAGGATFRAEKRGVLALGAKATEDEAVDRAFAIRMELAPDADARALLAPLVRPLAALAEIAPAIEVRADSLHVGIDGVHAERAPALLGATLDLWQSINRMRAGLT